MTTKELKALLAQVPDDWTVVVEQPEGDRYHLNGGKSDPDKKELVLEL